MNLKIRAENKNDFNGIYELNALAFGQESESKLIELLRKSKSFVPELSIVAVTDNKIVGHILFTKIRIIDEENAEHESLALAPMAVRPEFQRNGIGGQLIQYGLATARTLKYKSVIVLGHESYYPKFGFVPAEKWNIRTHYDVPSNVFMGLELITGGLKNVSGMVKYPEEFDAV